MDLLLVEDDDLVRDMLAELLACTTCRVACLSNAEDVLAWPIGSPVPDVVVTDINLGPGVNGLSLGEAVKQRWATTGIVYISGLAAQMNGRKLGPRERFVPKPFHIKDLMQAIRAVSDCPNEPVMSCSLA